MKQNQTNKRRGAAAVAIVVVAGALYLAGRVVGKSLDNSPERDRGFG
jgi:hypothetical protein